MSDETCSDCVYYHKYEEKKLGDQDGECRYGPPQLFAWSEPQKKPVMNKATGIVEVQTAQVTKIQTRYPPIPLTFPACGQFVRW